MPQELRLIESSSSFNDIISHKQGFMARWGLMCIAFVLLMVLAAAYFIEYPDVIITKAKLNAANTPKEIKSRVAGKLTALFVKEGDSVKEGALIGFMESTASHEKVLQLNKK